MPKKSGLSNFFLAVGVSILLVLITTGILIFQGHKPSLKIDPKYAITDTSAPLGLRELPPGLTFTHLTGGKKIAMEVRILN